MGENERMSQNPPPVGTVYLIGAGPGDSGLLTLRGADLLSRCDVVLFDGLSNREMLRHAPSARHICVGKHGQSRIWKQHEIIAEMLSLAQSGLTVARLKGGDPAVFARTAEEVDALKEAQIPFEIVPGITAALAAGSYAGIPITHRKHASAVAFVTGHEEPGKESSALDWEALARFPGTLVVYMGVTTAAVWTRALMQAGKPADTPAALVRRCSYGDQRTIHCTLGEIANELTPPSKLRPPVIAIIGAVADLGVTADWISQRPLLGQTVLVTRPVRQANSLVDLLREQGASVLCQPAIEIGPPDDWCDVDEAIDSLSQYEVVVFCSKNGVDFFLDRLLQRGGDLRSFASCKLAVVGSQTAKALERFHLRADIVPADFQAEALAGELQQQAAGKKILILRASRGSTVLRDQLADVADVTEVVAYQNTDVQQADAEITKSLTDSQIDWVTVTSSASAESLHNLFNDSLGNARIASLSPVTSATLTDLGYDVSAQANPYTMNSLVQAIIQATQETAHP